MIETLDVDLKGSWTHAGMEVKGVAWEADTKPIGNILCVCQGCGKRDYPDLPLNFILHESDPARNHFISGIKDLQLIQNIHADSQDDFPLTPFARHHIPPFGSRYNKICFVKDRKVLL